MSPSNSDIVTGLEARIIIDATSPNFVRISLHERQGDDKFHYINLNKLMNGALNIGLPNGGHLRRYQSGGLYLYGSPKELAEYLASKGYKTVSAKVLSDTLKTLVTR